MRVCKAFKVGYSNEVALNGRPFLCSRHSEERSDVGIYRCTYNFVIRKVLLNFEYETAVRLHTWQ